MYILNIPTGNPNGDHLYSASYLELNIVVLKASELYLKYY